MIRKGTKEDLPRILELIIELAEFEKGLDQVTITLEKLEEEGFGEHPLYGFFVTEEGNSIVGASIYYYRFSTWKGRRLYLEDLIVSEKWRGKGYGKALFEKTIELAKNNHCSGMTWQALDWNEPALNFYRKNQSSFDYEWVNCNIDFRLPLK